MSDTTYSGSAGVIFTPDELLTMWAEMCRHPTEDNEIMRAKIKAWLEARNSGRKIVGVV